MENYLLSLKSTVACGLSSSCSGWMTDTILGLLCGLCLFFLLVSWRQCTPSLSPPRKDRNTRKHHKKLKGNYRSRTKRRALKACRDCLKELQDVREMISLLSSHLRKNTAKCSSHQSSGEEPPGKLLEDASAGVLQHPRQCAEDATPALSLSASPISLTSTNAPGPIFSSPPVNSPSRLRVSVTPETSPPLKFSSLQPPSFSPQPSAPPESEAWPPSLKAASGCPLPHTTLTSPPCDSTELPKGTAWFSPPPWYTPPYTPWPPSVRTLSGIGRSTHPNSCKTWGKTTAKSLRVSASSRPKSEPEPLSNPSQNYSLWGDTRTPELETARPPFMSPDILEILKVLIQKQAEQNCGRRMKR